MKTQGILVASWTNWFTEYCILNCVVLCLFIAFNQFNLYYDADISKWCILKQQEHIPWFMRHFYLISDSCFSWFLMFHNSCLMEEVGIQYTPVLHAFIPCNLVVIPRTWGCIHQKFSSINLRPTLYWAVLPHSHEFISPLGGLKFKCGLHLT